MTEPDGVLTIVPVRNKRENRDWLSIPYRVFADDPAWIAPLRAIERNRISRSEAPFFSFGEAELFLAYRGDRPVGRITAQVNFRHLEFHRDETGHFGFFDCLNDPQAAQALIANASDWLRTRGMRRIAGPFSFTLNEECGCLVNGFETPPIVMMGHARPFTGALLESAGLAKETDLFTYRISREKFVSLDGLSNLATRMSNVSVRPFDFSRFDQELDLLIDIFNDSWSGNWGFVPLTRQEVQHQAGDVRRFLNNDCGHFLLIDGQPVGVVLVLPDINGIISSFNGRLLPFNWLKLAWALKRRSFTGARMVLMGLKRSFLDRPSSGALFALLAKGLIAMRDRYPVDYLDLGWVLESNARVTRLAESIAGPPNKTYRIYSMPLA